MTLHPDKTDDKAYGLPLYFAETALVNFFHDSKPGRV